MMVTASLVLATMVLGNIFAVQSANVPNFSLSYPDGSRVQVLMIEPTGGIIRIISSPPNAPSSFLHYTLEVPQPPLPEGAGFSVGETAEAFILSSQASVVSVNKTVATASVARQGSLNPLSVELQPVTQEDQLQCGNGHGGPIESGCIRSWRSLQVDEKIFGFGVQFTEVDHTGTTKFIRTNAGPDSDGLTHNPAPFFVSSLNYGVAINAHAYTYFDIGYAFPALNSKDSTSAGSRWSDSHLPAAADSARASGLGLHLMHTADPVMDLYFFMGPTPAAILAQYTQVYGRTTLPPLWALGQWYHPQVTSNETTVENIVAAWANNSVPLAAVTLEPTWQTHAYSCTYVWNNGKYPDPSAMIANLHASGVEVTLWQHAYIYQNGSGGLVSPLWDPIHSGGLAALDWMTWEGAVPDWTLPKTREIVSAYFTRNFIAAGVAAFKLDECDGTNPGTPQDWFFQDNTSFPSGFKGYQMHNIFGLTYGLTYHDMFAAAGLRTFLKARANYMGGQRHPTTTYSDSYDYGQYTTAVVNSGWGGFTWAPELRDAAYPSEFARRAQLMMFSGLSSMDGWNSGFVPFPPSVSTDSAAIFKKFYDARMTLIPSLYAAYEEQSQSGLPAVRSLLIDYWNDATLATIKDEYLLAGVLLIAPAPINGTSRYVYFPGPKDVSPSWVDYFNPTGSPVYTASSNISFACPDDVLPVFQRTNSILALAHPAHADVIRLHAVAGVDGANESSPAPLYDDDGRSTQYTKGLFYRARARFSLTATLPSNTSSWVLQGRVSVEHAGWKPKWVTVLWEVSLPSSHALRTARITVGAASCGAQRMVAAASMDDLLARSANGSYTVEDGVVYMTAPLPTAPGTHAACSLVLHQI